jgi:predicted unusual protein kinase regulating ubiquinone biosynthesis (AarF/ABC1/UbiB family)
MIRNRYRRILLFFAGILLQLIFWELFVPRLGLRRMAAKSRPNRLRQAAVRFRKLAVDMGGVLIKVGQLLSTRVDVFPEEITDELAGLQDEVPAADFDKIREIAEDELGCRLEDAFLEFNPIPVAAASLGQAYRARRAADANDPTEIQDVVVKIQRPQIEAIIATDFRALKTVGRWVKNYPPIRKRVDLPALIKDMERVLYEEIDYLSEGKNAEIFASNFRGTQGLCSPRVIWQTTTRRVLTLEDVTGIKISENEEITAAGISLPDVADRLFETYITQIFEHGFFHADPHPGNLFVLPRGPQESPEGPEWELVYIDFGMVGRVSPDMLDGLRDLVIGVGTRNPERMVTAYQKLGVLLPSADLAILEEVEERMFSRFWGKSMAELRTISFDEIHEIALEFRELIYELPFQVPQNLIWLGRTVAILSGMCTSLNPDFNVWDSIQPFAEKLIAQEARERRSEWLGELTEIGRDLIGLPQRINRVFTLAEKGQLQFRSMDIRRQTERIEKAQRRIASSIVCTAFLLAGTLLLISGYEAQAWWFFGIGLATLTWGRIRY